MTNDQAFKLENLAPRAQHWAYKFRKAKILETLEKMIEAAEREARKLPTLEKHRELDAINDAAICREIEIKKDERAASQRAELSKPKRKRITAKTLRRVAGPAARFILKYDPREKLCFFVTQEPVGENGAFKQTRKSDPFNCRAKASRAFLEAVRLAESKGYRFNVDMMYG